MAASVSNKGSSAVGKGKPLSQEQIINGFNELRQQQRQFITKISEIGDEKKEHQLVIDTLKDVETKRKCYRMIGGVLVERTVGDVLPALIHNVEQMSKLMESLEKQVEQKGKELQEYREKHNIRVQGEAPSKPAEEDKSTEAKSAGVLVNS